MAKVDATTNDVPDEVQGFPTLKLFPAGKGMAPIEYTGTRTIEDLAAFIRDNGSHKVDVVAAAEAVSAADTAEAKQPDAAEAPEASEEVEAQTVTSTVQVAEATPVIDIDDLEHNEL